MDGREDANILAETILQEATAIMRYADSANVLRKLASWVSEDVGQ